MGRTHLLHKPLIVNKMQKLFCDFIDAINFLVRYLDLENVKEKNEKYETPKIGVDYFSDLTMTDGKFNIHLRTDSKTENLEVWKTLRLSIIFYNKYDLCQLYKFEVFKKDEKVDMIIPLYKVTFLKKDEKVDIIKWIEEFANEYREKKLSNDLHFLFGDRYIMMRGIPHGTNTTGLEFALNLKGYLSFKPERLLVYRFYHKDTNLFSYAFLITFRMLVFDYSYWCVFPAFVGNVGGTSYSGYQFVESLLKETEKKINVEVIDIEVNENEFMDFIAKEHIHLPTKTSLKQEVIDLKEPSDVVNEIDFNEFKQKWSLVQTSVTNKQKKETLEDLIQFMFNSITGLQVRHKNFRTTTEEIDMMVSNESNSNFWRGLGDPIFVECKNWSEKIEAKHLRDFKGKLKAQNVTTGFFISKMGVTKGFDVLIRESKQEGFGIITLTGDDLEEIAQGKNPTQKIQEIFYKNYTL